jgi:hypothetical protein
MDPWAGAKRLRGAVRKVAAVLEEADWRVTHAQLVAMCASTTPSAQGKVGLYLFCVFAV